MVMADENTKFTEEKTTKPDSEDKESKSLDKSSLRYEDGKCFYRGFGQKMND